MTEIAKRFERWRLSLHDPALAISGTTESEKHQIRSGIASYIDRINETKVRYPDFFSRFDYEWTSDPANYSDAFEPRLQSFLLSILPEVSEEHPHHEKLGNIAVRTIGSSHFSCESIVDGEFKYIILSTSFFKIFNAFLIAMFRLAERGSSVDVKANPIETDYLGGRSCAAALLDDFDGCAPIIDDFLAVPFCYADSRIPPPQRYRLNQLLADRPAQEIINWIGRYDAIEGFAICHELVHVLRHEFDATKPRLAEEIEADLYACSFYFILQSRGLRHYPAAYLIGPAFFFQIAALFLAIKTAMKVSKREKLDEHKEHTSTLVGRARAFPDLLRSFDLRGEKSSQAEVSYWTFSEEVRAVTTACRVRMLQSRGGESCPTYREFLTRAHERSQ